MRSDPEFLEHRPILAQVDGTIYAGNQRYQAARHLGWETVPAIIGDVPDHIAKERSLKDNAHAGEWQEQELAELLAELQLGGSELDLLGFEPFKLNQLIGDGVDDPTAEWQGMPAFEHEDKTAHQTIQVHFPDADAVATFAALIGQHVNPETKALWYPKQETIRYGEVHAA